MDDLISNPRYLAEESCWLLEDESSGVEYKIGGTANGYNLDELQRAKFIHHSLGAIKEFIENWLATYLVNSEKVPIQEGLCIETVCFSPKGNWLVLLWGQISDPYMYWGFEVTAPPDGRLAMNKVTLEVS